MIGTSIQLSLSYTYMHSFGRFEDDREPQMIRRPDGLWTGESGPRYTRVSGVLVADHVLSWTVDSSSIRYYSNPYATHPIGGRLRTLPHAVVRGDTYQWQDGRHPGDILEVASLA